MDSFLGAALQGLVAVFTWPAIGYMFVGILVGMFLGMVPGLSGLTGFAILLPLAFGKTPTEAFALLLGMYAVTTMTDTIPAVLFGVPGTAVAQATCVDGYPLARNGEAGRALGASYTANIIAAIFSGLVFIVSIRAVEPIVLSFGAAEFFMLGLLGLTMVGSVSGNNVMKGIVVAGLGALLSMVGLAHDGLPRFTLGSVYLWSGVPLVPLVLGLFGLPELIELATSRMSVSRVPASSVSEGTWRGIVDGLRNWPLIMRSSALGAWCGFIPGLGGTVAEWFGYSHALQSARDKSRFGKGDIRGVLGPESATAGQKPTALVPTIAFGVPSDVGMAMLMGAFLIVGLKPGAQMLTTHLNVTFSMMWTMVVANIISALLLLVLSRQLVRLTFIDPLVLIPFMLASMYIGAVATNGDILDLVTFFAFGLLGWLMEKNGWPRPPLALGVVLGSLMEANLMIAVSAYGFSWLGRPLVIGIGVLTLLSIGWTAKQKMKAQRIGEGHTAPAPESV